MVWRIASWLALAIAGVVLAFFLYRKRHEFVFKFLLGAIFSITLNQSLKYIFNIPRVVGIGPTFPSFHAQMVFFVVVLASFEERKLAWMLVPLAFFIGASRVALGFHSMEDVAVGALLGIIVAAWLFKIRLKEFHVRELGRQALHFTGILLVPLAVVFSPTAVGLLCALLVAFALVAPRTGVERIARFFTRAKEHGYAGAMMFFASTGFVLFAFPQHIAFAGIVALSVGDSVSTVYGTHFGRVRLFGKKTLEGSLACFFFIYSAVLFLLGPEMAFPAALAGTIIELLPKVPDNLAIPVGVCLALSLLGL